MWLGLQSGARLDEVLRQSIMLECVKGDRAREQIADHPLRRRAQAEAAAWVSFLNGGEHPRKPWPEAVI